MLACLPGPGDLSFQLLSYTQMNTGLQKCEWRFVCRMWLTVKSGSGTAVKQNIQGAAEKLCNARGWVQFCLQGIHPINNGMWNRYGGSRVCSKAWQRLILTTARQNAGMVSVRFLPLLKMCCARSVSLDLLLSTTSIPYSFSFPFI